MDNETVIKGPDSDRLISVWGGNIAIRVRCAGRGPALVYFHPAGGLYWDEFLDNLAKTHTVYAPELPGTTPGDPYAIHKVDRYTDLLLMYEEVISKLQLENPIAVGQSMGGMIALDLAATYPKLFAHLIALAPTGLWRENAPVGLADLYALPAEEIPAYLFSDPSIPAAEKMFSLPQDPEQIPTHVAQNVWALGCAGKFLWPIPDHGLRQRLHRITAPTLILWGADDRVVPADYAEDFGASIPDSRVCIFENCGHVVQIDQQEQTLNRVKQFVG